MCRMIFVDPYRARKPRHAVYYISKKKFKKAATQKWRTDAEAGRKTAGLKYRRVPLTSRSTIGSFIRTGLALLAIVALMWYSLYRAMCVHPTLDPFLPHVLQPCTWIDLNATENPSLYFAHYNVGVTVTPPNPCDNGTDLLIIVHSRPRNLNARQAIRETWGTLQEGGGIKCRVLFLLGYDPNPWRKNVRGINREIRVHNDMIITTLLDTYANLSLKSTVMLHWVLTFCPDAKYLLKTDDDVYVNVERLKRFASDLPVKNGTIYGHIVKNGVPHRHPSDKWYVSRARYPENRYPTFIVGNAYFMTGDVIQPLCKTAVATPSFPFEDVFLTGICAEKTGIRRISHPDMINVFPESVCMVKNYLTVHYVKPWLMRYIWFSNGKRSSDNIPKSAIGEHLTIKLGPVSLNVA